MGKRPEDRSSLRMCLSRDRHRVGELMTPSGILLPANERAFTHVSDIRAIANYSAPIAGLFIEACISMRAMCILRHRPVPLPRE